ncbi:N-acetylglucosamine kinase [Phytoactinopolyspora mesophila]|uniref:ATPase BadF/BadG/BcrA/BcrD type domain-containing protein n=1 Tax=Phytoactinopolyspora mesophila TaxID=2650750 RepID=A0A7K3LYX5_9ACTN|nr:BadF/BadG/BcrA/BcrD ATPase family protein [Phytoactinopolyspora mesophila]NDL56200.1 hypothetical protein [Phytoactinopolyspora mesophila]
MNIAGIDVGGGGVRGQLEFQGRATLFDDGRPVPRINGKVDVARLAPRIVDALNAPSAQGTRRYHAVAIGMTGVPGLDDAPAELSRALSRQLDIDTFILAGDVLTTHVGSLEYEPGVVVAAGTGAIALGTDFEHIWRRVDGWGYALGDDGGGAWIGARGLRAALRAHDGREDGSAALLERLHAVYGHPSKLVAHTYDVPSPAHVLAQFATAVAEAAHTGDPIANGIWRDAGRCLAQAAAAAAFGSQPRVSWGGRLFDAGQLLLDPFTTSLVALVPDVRVVSPSGTSTDGALALARKATRGEVVHSPPYLYVMTGR